MREGGGSVKWNIKNKDQSKKNPKTSLRNLVSLCLD